jgi:hypothetical protein
VLDYVYGHDETVARFVQELTPAVRERGFGRCKAIGIIDGTGSLIAGVVYHNYDPDAEIIQMSGAALPGMWWVSRETLRRTFSYPFLQLGCQMVLMQVPATDERLLRQLAALNFTFVKIPRLLGRGRDAVACLLTAEDWAANKFNKRYQHHIDAQLSEAA